MILLLVMDFRSLVHSVRTLMTAVPSAALVTKRLAVQPAAKRSTSRSSAPPHQFWETFMCTCISINLCFALLENRDEGTIQAVQTYSTLFIIALSCVDVTLKSLAYGGRGYLSSLSDNCDFCVTILMVSGQIWRDTDRNMAQDLASVLRVFGARLAFYRVPRLLRNWRFLLPWALRYVYFSGRRQL